MMSRILIDNYLHLLNDLQEGDPWIDETFRKKLESVDERDVFIRPHPGIHSVAELLSHLVEWRLAIIKAMKGKPYISIFDAPENWLGNDELKKTCWETLKNNFYSSQKEVVSILEKENDAWLGKVYSNGYNIKYLVDGLLEHDVYHLGQLGVTIKLLKKNEMLGSPQESNTMA